jgi:predicted DNA binding CopG/RHH family protein
MKRLELISDIIKDLQKTIDDIEWENHRDPRIESLVQQLNYYKNKHEQGETYEPRF